MKKMLVLAGWLAVSGGSWAQSSITLYGVADAAFGKMIYDKTGMKGNSAVNTSDSFIGLGGNEDLGDGLRAGFVFEQAINIENGATDEHSTHTPNTPYRRAANIWLGGTWGTLRMGQAFTPSRNALVTWDVMEGANNSAPILAYGAVGGLSPQRQSSQLSYRTPSLGGLVAEMAYVTKHDNDGRAKWDVGVTYASGPWRAGVAANKEQQRKTNYAAGLQYAFGIFSVGAGYYAMDNGVRFGDDARPVAGTIGRARGVSLGAKARFGAFSLATTLVRDLKADYLLDGARHREKKITSGVLEGRYAFSKRTFAYANYLRILERNNWGVGVRHDF